MNYSQHSHLLYFHLLFHKSECLIKTFFGFSSISLLFQLFNQCYSCSDHLVQKWSFLCTSYQLYCDVLDCFLNLIKNDFHWMYLPMIQHVIFITLLDHFYSYLKVTDVFYFVQKMYLTFDSSGCFETCHDLVKIS